MSETLPEVPAEVRGWIGEERYREEGEFPVEQGYIWTACSSVEMGNPLYWDDKVANELTDGVIAPPTMISTWFRPHHWAPGRTKQALPLQIHFDLKETLALPEAIMSDYTVTFGEPIATSEFGKRDGPQLTRLLEERVQAILDETGADEESL